MRFSVTVPAYKKAFLEECIDSILGQSFKDFELIIVNDASPEDLDSVVKAFHDSRLRYYINEKNCGALNVVDNWNKCLEYAKGEYVICMGDDDKLSPNCLEEYNNLIEKYPGIGLLHGWTEIIGEDSIPYQITTHRCEYESAQSLAWHRWTAYKHQYIGDFCFEKQWLIEHGGFYKLPLAWAADDISALIGASKNGVANTQTIVFQYRKNRQTISSTGEAKFKLEGIVLEMDWYRQFLKLEPKEFVDKLYLKGMTDMFDRFFLKKKGQAIGQDMKNHPFGSILRWWKFRHKFGINIKVLCYAFYVFLSH